MKKTFHFVVALGIAAVSLSSCSRSNYAFNNSAPAYLGSEQVHVPVAAAPAPSTAPTAASPAALQVAEAEPVRHTARHSAHRAHAHAAAKAEFKAPVVAGTEQAVKIDHKAAKAIKKELKRQLAAAPQSTTAEGKSQIVAAVLNFFLGFLGIHRFYLGYVGMGILELLTLGGFGILSLIDFIRILIGNLKPKNGEYAKKI